MIAPLRRLGAAALAAGLCAVAAAAAAQTAERFAIRNEHISLVFMVERFGYARQMGKFLDISGEFTFDPARPAASTVEARIAATSLFTNHHYRDTWLKSERMLDALKHPVLTFKSTRVEPTGERTARVVGDMTLRGVTVPVTLEVTFNRMADNPIDKKLIAGFSARGSVKRSDFGMTGNLNSIADRIDFLIEVEGVKP